ncbi:MAG TPA: AEC family transporter [Anaerolineae bacterium]|nr:AEC family transporter [Anaerolineae bacterium]HQI86143.1 AEC family transporter [Anaerolineae bacterium]
MPDPTITNKVLVNLLLIAVGYLIKKLGVVSRDDGRILNRLVLYLTLPMMNLKAVMNTPLSWHLLLLPLTLLFVGVVMCLFSRYPARWLHLPQRDTGTFMVASCGFMGSLLYPFIEAVYGDPGIQATAICDLGNAIAIFGVGYYISFRYATNGHFKTMDAVKKVLLFFPMHAFVVGLLLNIGNIPLRGLPADLVNALAAVNSPLMLLGLGIYLELDISRQERKVVAVNMVYRYIVGALIALLVLWLLPYRGPLRAVMFLFPLMPCALSSLLYSVEQGLNPRLAAMLISASMLISLVVLTVALLGFSTAF